MLSLGAEDVISIGSDYDGCRIKPELRGIEKIPSICVYLEAVSYTHLDVYKRQAQRHA